MEFGFVPFLFGFCSERRGGIKKGKVFVYGSVVGINDSRESKKGIVK